MYLWHMTYQKKRSGILLKRRALEILNLEEKTLNELKGKEDVVEGTITIGCGEFAPEFAHFNDDVLFGENWNNRDIDIKTRSIIS